MSSKNKLIELFKLADLEFDITKLSLSLPYPIEENREGHNTGVVIRASNIEDGYIGNKTFTYYRKSLSTLFHKVKPSLDLRNVTRHEDAIKAINDRFGLELDANEFVSVKPSLDQGFFLKPIPENYEYIGEIMFTHAIPLSTVKKNRVEGFNYPSNATDMIQGSIYSKNVDKVVSVYFTTLKQGDSVATALAARLISYYTRDTWVLSETPSEFNLRGAVVKSCEKDASVEDGHLYNVIISLDKNYCTNVANELHFTTFIPNSLYPLTATVDFSAARTLLTALNLPARLKQPNVDGLNNLFTAANLPVSVSTEFTVVYSGPVNQVPDLYLPLVNLATSNIIILVNGFSTQTAPIVLAYN